MLLTGIPANRPSPIAAGPRERRVLRIAFAASLALHVIGAAATWRLPLASEIDPRLARRSSEDVDLILVPDEAQDEAETDRPTAYAAVPERQASETPPERADYLALHHSLAADNEVGDGDQPSAAEEAEYDMVEIRREELEGAGGVTYAPQVLRQEDQTAGGDEALTESRRATPAPGEDRGALGELALPGSTTEPGETEAEQESGATGPNQPEMAEWWSGSAPSILKEGERSNIGDRGFDFNQLASGHVTSGVAIVDNFQLNTWEWDFAPWIQAFANELHRHWQAPYAYKLGVIDGKTVLRLVVEKDGRPSSMEVVDTEGHASLHDASRAALQAFAPYAPLPPHFPEENLVITLSLHYPAWRR